MESDIPFLENRAYMTFQLAVCLVFITDFFLELALTPHGRRKAYIRTRWLMLPIYTVNSGYIITPMNERITDMILPATVMGATGLLCNIGSITPHNL